MKRIIKTGILLFFLCSALFSGCTDSEKTTGRNSDFNFGWKFSLDETGEAWKPDFNDSGWRTLNLPHDWVVENSSDSTLEFWQGTGRIPGKGIGWYRKSFDLSFTENEVCYLLFDGVYNNSEIWLNGNRLGSHPYGYSPFFYDLTPFLNKNGKANVIVVKVDHTRYADSRWYTGAGIYRNVSLIKTNGLHVPVWGTFITTPEVSPEHAVVNIETRVRNSYPDNREFTLKTTVYSPAGLQVAVKEEHGRIEKDTVSVFSQVFNFEKPALWDTENPHLYKAVTEIVIDTTAVDIYETRFGIRSIRFDVDEGFYLNGKNMKIKGVCLHHDGGLAGSAVPKGVWKRRLEILKEAGCNAIRTSHNPASTEFLDLCDEMGFLVQDEFFDEWDYPKDKRFNTFEKSVHYETQGYVEHFQEWAERDIETTMLSHRNHPSIFQWSLGNEIEHTYQRHRMATGYFNNPKYKGNWGFDLSPYSLQDVRNVLDTFKSEKYLMENTARKLAEWTRRHDTTRYVTINLIHPVPSLVSGVGESVDIAGFSYGAPLYDLLRRNFPGKSFTGTENYAKWHEWKSVLDRPYISGVFLWTGIDYMGEIGGQWPSRASASGIIDLAGNKKPSWHMFKTLWTDKPYIYMVTGIPENIRFGRGPLYKIDNKGNVVEQNPGRWKRFQWGWQTVNEHWNYEKGDTVIVEAYTNCETAELFVNGKSCGTKKIEDYEDRIIKWAVVYEPGELKITGRKGNPETSFTYNTAGKLADIKIIEEKTSLKADGYDVAHILVQLVDENGIPVLSDDRLIEFEVDKKLRLLGVDNGNPGNVQDFQADKIKTDKGHALLIVQSKSLKGKAVVRVRSKDIGEKIITFTLE